MKMKQQVFGFFAGPENLKTFSKTGAKMRIEFGKKDENESYSFHHHEYRFFVFDF